MIKLSSIDAVNESIRAWLVNLFINVIRVVSKEEDRLEVIRWLALSREVIESKSSTRDKCVELYSLMDGRKTVAIVVNGVVEGVRNYKTSELPLAVKIAVPLTLLAVPFIGGQGAGVAAFGTAIGLPVLLLLFLGTMGITVIIDAFVGNENAKTYLGTVLALIAHDEVLRQVKAEIKNGRQGQPRESFRHKMPNDEPELREKLLAMDPFDFESHVMSFFRGAGMFACVTKKSSDKGFDGFARHAEGLIVVQCKRNAPSNPVGRPVIQQFKGVIEENQAWRGYFVTTSRFTEDALESAEASQKLVLVEMNELVGWHKLVPRF